MKTTIAQRVRELLAGLCNHREAAYKAVMAAGKEVPNYSLKMATIKKIREHLEAFTTASDKANINLVHALESDIKIILPNDSINPRIAKYRQQILKMVAWCNEQFQTDQLHLKL